VFNVHRDKITRFVKIGFYLCLGHGGQLENKSSLLLPFYTSSFCWLVFILEMQKMSSSLWGGGCMKEHNQFTGALRVPLGKRYL
jgi:hypothetical protein